jgi:dihydrofolate reductase
MDPAAYGMDTRATMNPDPVKQDKPEIVIIAAVGAQNRVIGKEMDLPWHIPEDLKRFKQLTTGHALLMGRKTFESLLHQWGRPLPNRRNVVLTTRGEIPGHPQVEAYRTVEEALEACAGEDVVFIGGGAALYEQFLPLADRMELTLVEGEYEGDTYFPPYEHLIGTVYDVESDERRDGYRFVTYLRRP